MSLEYISEKIIDLLTRDQLVEMVKELQKENANLINKINEFEAWDIRSEPYEEFQIPETQAVVIKHKQKNIYYCPVCFETKTLISLQPLGEIRKSCPKCKNDYDFKQSYPEAPRQYDPFNISGY